VDSTEAARGKSSRDQSSAVGLRMHSEQCHECDKFVDAEEREKGMMCTEGSDESLSASVSPRAGAYLVLLISKSRQLYLQSQI
jgi:hypothetical protein